MVQAKESVSTKEHFEAILDLERDHLIAIINSLEKRYEQGAEADRRAVDVALESINKRLENQNEFRGTINDIVRGLVTRTEADIKFKAIDDKIKINSDAIASISQTLAATEGRGTGYQKSMALVFSLIGAAVALAGAAATVFLRK